jgi:hypothetical protein
MHIKGQGKDYGALRREIRCPLCPHFLLLEIANNDIRAIGLRNRLQNQGGIAAAKPGGTIVENEFIHPSGGIGLQDLVPGAARAQFCQSPGGILVNAIGL